jgi:uncharacterized Zn finger protein
MLSIVAAPGALVAPNRLSRATEWRTEPAAGRKRSGEWSRSAVLSAGAANLRGMPRVVLDEIDLESIEDAVGVHTYGTGYREMRKGVVRRMEWVAGRSALHGVVQDKGGEFHETVVYFSGRPMRFGRGYCSCPVGCECKHAAALALAGAVSSGQDPADRPASVSW